ncbi:MAG: sigma-70 family RNA polymerase sigma factor [Actinomycetota bacterium]|nr:sigma-70 family RNA polymerase sigma factor [Actinomycetota bacterium]
MEADDGDFDPVFRRLFPMAARLAYRIVGDREQAEDIAAEACAKALARWGRVGRLAYREAWVMRVASNLALDAVKRTAPPSQPDVPMSDIGESVALRVAVAVALRTLPRRQREVIVLRYFVGLPDCEVAGALGIAEGTVRTHARRGLGALRERGILSLEDAAR